MANKGCVLFWTDVVLAALSLAVLATGAVLKWALPPGSGGLHGGQWRGGRGPAPELLDLSRHQWGNVHFWLAVALIVCVLAHVLLHAGWVASACRRYANPFRRSRASTPLVGV